MRIIKPSAATPANASASGGGSGMPSWRRIWLENKVRWVELECGHIEDLNDRTLMFINSFKGSKIDCVKCQRFCAVVKTLKRRHPPVKYTQTPMF